MAHVVWDPVHERLIEAYVEADLTVFDLSMEHRHQINGTVTLDAPQALKTRDVGVKCATIRAEKVVLEKYHLKRMWMSPNTAIRNALGGAVFPELIVCCNIHPRVKQWCRPIIIARHAFCDQYNGQDFVVPGPGVLQIKYSPTIGAPYNLEARRPAHERDFADLLGAQPPEEEFLQLQATPRFYQATKSDECKIAALKKERDDLAAILSSQPSTKSAAENKVAEQRRKHIHELGDSVDQLQKTVNEQSRTIRLKEDAERSAKKLQQEISNLKQARVQLMKCMKKKSERHQRQQTEGTREIRALRIREQQSAHRARMERQNTLCTNVLQRRVEEALAAKNRYEVAQRRRLESRANGNGFDSMSSPV